MHGAQRKHIFFAGVPKWTGHMSMRDQSALLTVAFSLSAASRCLQEQETDGARGDPPAGGRESCTSRTCCARLGACAPLSDLPRLRVAKIGTLMGARLALAGAVLCARWTDEGAAAGHQERRTLPLLPVLAAAAGQRQLCAAAAAAAVGVDAAPLSPLRRTWVLRGTSGRRRARVALQLCCCFRHGGCTACRDALEHVLVVQ